MEGKIVALYMPLRGEPLRFIIHRKLTWDREALDIYRCATLGGLIAKTLEVLGAAVPDLMSRLQQLDDEEFQKSPHKTRRYIADRRDLLYINAPHLTEKHSLHVLDCWVATNVNRKVANHIIWLACKAAGIKRENVTRLAV